MQITVLENGPKGTNVKSLLVRATGRFYTHPTIAEHLVDALLKATYFTPLKEFRIVDPFCGDGRLLVSFLEKIKSFEHCRRNMHWIISAWDRDREAAATAQAALTKVIGDLSLKADLDIRCWDTFIESSKEHESFDCVITNPPWEALKPDRRELAHLSETKAKQYISSLRSYDNRLAGVLPLSQPFKKFAGWGTNLSRCGFEVSLRLLKKNAICGIVLPFSILTDQMTVRLRKWILEEHTLLHIFHYPPEARLFEFVDQDSIASVLTRDKIRAFETTVHKFDRDLQLADKYNIPLSSANLESLNFAIPIEAGRSLIRCMSKWKDYMAFGELEGKGADNLWAGRELDETDHKRFLRRFGKYKFLKGRQVDRFHFSTPENFVDETAVLVPTSANHPRVTWRDVARRSRGRRVQAALIQPGIVTGNSLHVAYFRNDDITRLKALLAVINSIPFEFQVRSMLGTGHISLGVIRKVKIPDLTNREVCQYLAAQVDDLPKSAIALEVHVAKLYRLSRLEYKNLLAHFDGLPEVEKQRLLVHQDWDRASDQKEVSRKQVISKKIPIVNRVVIPNHYSARLSANDLQMSIAVKPGGNWKNIPASIPSQRLETIRKSYAAGEGSRSTYYGRLLPNLPSYTINTYFYRPGNGCHLHYDYSGKQHRVLSEREAARLQSFPDNFVFHGSHASIAKQIGNAVPPLLAYQIASTLKFKGYFIDLFSGAGGLSLGFKWAGWKPLIANDIDPIFLQTYSHNIHDKIVCGDIRDVSTFRTIVDTVRDFRSRRSDPIIVLGGPPCQGFSTAGKRRSMDDDRNHLFNEYKRILKEVRPQVFIFENVTGLLNMEGGKIFGLIHDNLRECAKTLAHWQLRTEEYAIPQRRSRICLVGHSLNIGDIEPPKRLTGNTKQHSLFDQTLHPMISVEEALSDLPRLSPGEDGSNKQYCHQPKTLYQKLMRGEIDVEQYIKLLDSRPQDIDKDDRHVTAQRIDSAKSSLQTPTSL
jgi:DNA-cytosine methyltransferase